MNERAAWRILLGQIMSDPQEQQRLAQAVGVQPMTLLRWASGTSSPRQEKSLHLLIKALPHYRQQLLTSLQEEFPSFTPADEEKEEEYAEGAILQLLQLSGTGPAARLDCEFAPRLNLLTGDNGLGKTFVLECAWWALTGSWAGYPARSRRDVGVPSMTFQVGNVGQSERIQATYSWDQLAWNAPARRSVLPGLSLFSRSDGSFVAWDPAKYLLGKKERSAGIEPALTRFSLSQMWDGVREQEEDGGRQKVLCNGLIDDWVRWQEAADQSRFEKLSAALQALSPDLDEEPLVPGRPTRMLELGDRRDIPTLQFPYGEVPILLCSAGIQRIVALAYLLVWAWQEHVKTAESMAREPERSIILLIDEMEAHLHPRWQRMIVPALMNVVSALSDTVETQLIIATHSPLVLASVEPLFDHEKDKLFHLNLEQGLVQLEHVPFFKRGPINEWLVSDIFGLTEPRSREAEQAIEDAKEIQLQKEPLREKVQEISDRLIKVLAADDEFWPTWVYFAKQRGVRFDARRNAS